VIFELSSEGKSNNQKGDRVGISIFKLAKTPCFSYYLLCFFFYKIGEQEVEHVLLRGREVGKEDGPNNVYTCK
jgi:hypothetical protein